MLLSELFTSGNYTADGGRSIDLYDDFMNDLK